MLGVPFFCRDISVHKTLAEKRAECNPGKGPAGGQNYGRFLGPYRTDRNVEGHSGPKRGHSF